MEPTTVHIEEGATPIWLCTACGHAFKDGEVIIEFNDAPGEFTSTGLAMHDGFCTHVGECTKIGAILFQLARSASELYVIRDYVEGLNRNS